MCKNKKRTKEHKELISKQVSQRRWWNNGEIDKHTTECPGDGWVLGRLYSRKLTDEEVENLRKIETSDDFMYEVENLSDRNRLKSSDLINQSNENGTGNSKDT